MQHLIPEARAMKECKPVFTVGEEQWLIATNVACIGMSLYLWSALPQCWLVVESCTEQTAINPH